MLIKTCIFRFNSLRPFDIFKRYVSLQEYHSKQILKDNGVNIQEFRIVKSKNEISQKTDSFKPSEYVVKAQILAGGRGKGTFTNGFKGGVRLTKDEKEMRHFVESMLNQKLVTKQTTSDGIMVNTVMVAEALDIAKEKYLAFLFDTKSSGYVLVYSNKGGVDIEEVAEKEPHEIHKIYINPSDGMTEEQLKKVALDMEFPELHPLHTVAKEQIKNLFKLFRNLDCTQVEVNPLGMTPDDRLVCFDAKIQFDSNAFFRQKKVIQNLEDSEEAPQDDTEIIERKANKLGLNYITLPSAKGDIGCVVNGAGLAMATMDIVKGSGGEPANFLDLGGSVSASQVESAFQLLSSDKRVKCILVNIFGGIVNCQTVAKGLVEAFNKHKKLAKYPLIVRLEGTNVTAAKEFLASQKNLNIHTADDMDSAAVLAVSIAKK